MEEVQPLFEQSDFSGALAAVERNLKEFGALCLLPVADHTETGKEGAASDDLERALWPLRELGGRCLIQLGRYDDAEPALIRAREIAERLFTPNGLEVAKILTDLGTCRIRSGDLAGARTVLEPSLAIRTELAGEESPPAAESSNLLGVVAHLEGDLVTAEAQYRRAISIMRARGMSDDPRLGNSLNNLGNVYQDMGDYRGALELNRQALDIFRAEFGPKHLSVSGSLLNLGLLWRHLGDFEKAATCLDEALEIRRLLLGPDHPAHGEILNSLGNLYEKTGDLARARSCYRQALALWKKTLDPSHNYIALGTYNVANILCKTGDLDTGRRLCREAMDDWEKNLVPDHPCIALGAHLLAEIDRLLGATEPAFVEACRSAEIRLQRSHEDFRLLSGRQMQRYLEIDEYDSFGLAMTLGEEAGEQTRDNWLPRLLDLELLRRGRMTEELSGRQLAAALSGEKGVQQLLEQYGRTREELARLSFDVRFSSDDSGHERLRELVELKEDLERRLARTSDRFALEQQAAATSMSGILQKLPPDTALVTFVRYRQAPPAIGGDEGSPVSLAAQRTGRMRDVALVHGGRGSRPVLVPIGWADETDRLLTSMMTAAGPRGPAGPPQARAYRRAAADVAARVWEPLADVLGSPRMVFVIPEGPLHLVNFAGLPGPDGRFLLESGWSFHYLNSARDIARFAGSSISKPSPVSLLVLGDIDFGSSGGSVEPPWSWPPLPHAAREVEIVAGCFPEDNVTFLVRGAGSEERFKSAAPGNSYIHLATHGFYLGSTTAEPESRYFRGAEGRSRSESSPAGEKDLLEQVGRDNPLLLSGIVLAGANRSRQPVGQDRPASDDAILTAEEVASLDLRETACVVLSGCRTGRGDIRDGEGVMGLRLGFRLAGAATVVSSITPVGDEDTCEWMISFYRERLAGCSVVEAAHRASRERLALIRQQKASDAYSARWAPFLTSGDWH